MREERTSWGRGSAGFEGGGQWPGIPGAQPAEGPPRRSTQLRRPLWKWSSLQRELATAVKVNGREQSRESWIEFRSEELVPVSEGGREPVKSMGLTWPELYFLAVNLAAWERLTGEGRLELDKARGQLGHGWKQVTEAQTEPAAIRTERRRVMEETAPG